MSTKDGLDRLQARLTVWACRVAGSEWPLWCYVTFSNASGAGPFACWERTDSGVWKRNNRWKQCVQNTFILVCTEWVWWPGIRECETRWAGLLFALSLPLHVLPASHSRSYLLLFLFFFSTSPSFQFHSVLRILFFFVAFFLSHHSVYFFFIHFCFFFFSFFLPMCFLFSFVPYFLLSFSVSHFHFFLILFFLCIFLLLLIIIILFICPFIYFCFSYLTFSPHVFWGLKFFELNL